MINNTAKKTISFLFFYAAVIAVALFGSQFMPTDWYVALKKSSLTPPNIVFPIVWTILYALMPLSIWLVYNKTTMLAFRRPLSLFTLQLFLNGIWTYLFFGLHQPLYAMIDIILLWMTLIGMIIVYSRVSIMAAWLQAPYVVWVSFAAYLNLQIVMLN